MNLGLEWLSNLDLLINWPMSWESQGILLFGPNTGNILLVISQKYSPKRLGFQQFLVMEKLNWSMESH